MALCKGGGHLKWSLHSLWKTDQLEHLVGCLLTWGLWMSEVLNLQVKFIYPWPGWPALPPSSYLTNLTPIKSGFDRNSQLRIRGVNSKMSTINSLVVLALLPEAFELISLSSQIFLIFKNEILKNFLKGTVSVISNDPSCKDDNTLKIFV